MDADVPESPAAEKPRVAISTWRCGAHRGAGWTDHLWTSALYQAALASALDSLTSRLPSR
jgi:hypothetical protein